jgi:hypothetical protein
LSGIEFERSADTDVPAVTKSAHADTHTDKHAEAAVLSIDRM